MYCPYSEICLTYIHLHSLEFARFNLDHYICKYTGVKPERLI